MPVINVVKAFTLQLDPIQIGTVFDEKENKEKPVFAQEGEKIKFPVGPMEVPENIANHWYVIPHLEGYDEPPPRPEMPDYNTRMLLAQRAGRNTTSMEDAKPPPAPAPAAIDARVYFAGKAQQDRPIPDKPSWVG